MRAIGNIGEMMPKALGIYDNAAEATISNDIITAIMEVYNESWRQTRDAAPSFVGASAYETAKNVWAWVRENIMYVVDPNGVQYIKTPAVTVRDRFGDCKSYSIFIASVLQNLGYSPVFRFVGYKPERPKLLTHVFIVLPISGREIIIDACIDRFDYTTHYNNHQDMATQIVKVSGPSVGFLKILKKKKSSSPAPTQVNPSGGFPAPGTVEPERTKLDSSKKRKTIFGKVLKTVVDVTKKATTLPLRAAIDMKLPKAAPFFLYLYMNDEQARNQPKNVQIKRNKAKKVAKFIVNQLAMEEKHFYERVRKGIKEEMKQEPEEVLRPYLNPAVSGPYVGIAPVIAAAAISALSSIILAAMQGGAAEPDFTEEEYEEYDDTYYMEGIGFLKIFKKKSSGGSGGKKSALGLKDFPEPDQDFKKNLAAKAIQAGGKLVSNLFKKKEPAPAPAPTVKKLVTSADLPSKKEIKQAAKAGRKLDRQEKREERRAEGKDILSLAKNVLGGGSAPAPSIPTPTIPTPTIPAPTLPRPIPQPTQLPEGEKVYDVVVPDPDKPKESSGAGLAIPLSLLLFLLK